MNMIKSWVDISTLMREQAISPDLGKHLNRKIMALKMALEPETDLKDFSLHQHGPIGILEKGDRNLTSIGLPESLAQVMPEWISRLEIAGESYYVLYVMTDNDCVVQVYLPDAILEETVRLWLDEQPAEEEVECGDELESIHPF